MTRTRLIFVTLPNISSKRVKTRSTNAVLACLILMLQMRTTVRMRSIVRDLAENQDQSGQDPLFRAPSGDRQLLARWIETTSG